MFLLLLFTLDGMLKEFETFMHQSIEIPAPGPRCIAGDSGDLTRLMRGFNTHLTTCCPRGAVELTSYSFDPGYERGFNTHAMDVFFLGFRQKRPLTTRNANAQGCYFSKWRTSQS